MINSLQFTIFVLINTIIIITLGDNIRNVREEKGGSQKEGALAADIEPSISTLEKIAIAFNIDVADFFNKDIPITVVRVLINP